MTKQSGPNRNVGGVESLMAAGVFLFSRDYHPSVSPHVIQTGDGNSFFFPIDLRLFESYTKDNQGFF